MDGETIQQNPSDPLRDQLMRFIAEAKYDEVMGIGHGTVLGRRLQLSGQQLTPMELRTIVIDQYLDIGRRLGSEFLRNTPAVALEQFVIMSITRDHDAAGLLKSLINSFIASYLTPETTGRAYSNLVVLEELRGEVTQARKAMQH